MEIIPKEHLTVSELTMLKRLRKKIGNVKTLEDLEIYKHHVGVILQLALERYERTLRKS